MKRVIVCAVLFLNFLVLPSGSIQATADMSGVFKTEGPAFIQEIEVNEDNVKVYILPNWTDEHMVEWLEMMILRPDTTRLIQPEDTGGSPYKVDYKQVLTDMASQVNDDTTYEEVDLALEQQVAGIYFHSEDMQHPYFNLTQTKAVKSGDFLYIRILKDDMLVLKIEDDQTLSLDGVLYKIQ